MTTLTTLPLLGENALFIDELGGTLLDPPPIPKEMEEAFAAIGDMTLDICSVFVQDLIDAVAFPTMVEDFNVEPKEETTFDLSPFNTALCAILMF